MEAEWKWMRPDGSGVWKGASQGGGQRGDKRKEGRGRSYHDITPLLCRYVSERCSSSLMLRAARASSGGGGSWRIRVLEVEFLNCCWGVDLSVGEPHVN